MSQSATTVFPKAVDADKIPVEFALSFLAASFCSLLSSPKN